MKKILTYIILLIVLILGAIFVFFDDIGKSITQTYLEKTLKTPVHISQFSSDFSAKTLKMDFIEVKNPKHYQNENAFVLNHLTLTLNPYSDKQLIVVDQLEFDGMLFTLEQNRNQVNLLAMLNQLQANTKNKHNKSNIVTTSPDNTLSDRRVIIKDLSFIGTQLKIDTQWFKDTISVPDIRLYEFGGHQGVPIHLLGSELMKIALVEIQQALEKQGLRLGEKEIKEGIRRQLESEIHELKDSLDDKAKGWLKKLGL